MNMPDIDSPEAGLRDIFAQDHPACRIFAARRDRRRFFDESLFGEPAWDMLLLLCCAEAGGIGVAANFLTGSAGVPVSVAQRWLAVLQHRGLVVRRQHADNIFFQTVELTDAGRSRMENYLKQFGEAP